MIKSYKVRIFPTEEQETMLWWHIHASRFIWNWGLAQREELYIDGQKASAFDMIKLLTPLKKTKQFSWLKTVSNTTLQQVMRDLDKSYSVFFKGTARHPKFKSRKKAKPCFPVRSTLYFKENFVHIEKVGKVRYKTKYDIKQVHGEKFSNPRIQYIKQNNKWILTLGVEVENQVPTLTDTKMGIDLGVKDLAIAAYGNKVMVYPNINKSKRVRNLEHKRIHIQRIISRKYNTNGSYIKTSNILRYETIQSSIEYKLANIRQNHRHQITQELTSQLPRRITVEDLNVSGMMRNRHLAKSIAEQGFYEFIRQVEYKCEFKGIEFQKVPAFYPSSKTCSCCGNIKSDLKLKDRVYVCDTCGLVIDRDTNAALNLQRYEKPPRRLSA